MRILLKWGADHFVPGILISVTDVANEQQRQSAINAAFEREKIIEWMSPLNFFQRQADIFSTWQPGTGDWLLTDVQFKMWKVSVGKILWCRGMPGAGKTVLASMVVNHLQSYYKNVNMGVACIYLNHKETAAHTPQNIIGGLWRQLVVGRPISDAVHALYKSHDEPQTKPSLKELQMVLTAAAAEYSKVYFIVDALDEYPEEQTNVLLDYLATVIPHVSLLITSRPHITLDPFLTQMQILEIRATEEDITQYVEKQISKSRKLSKHHVQNHPDLQNDIKYKITSNAQGMFLLAKLHIASLSTKNTVKAVREALGKLPKDLKNTYDEAMDRIDHQSEDDRRLAQLALTWVAHVKRPWTVGDLQEAVAIEPDSITLDRENLLDIDIVLSVCAGLIMVDETAFVVRLIHYTTQDYLDKFQTDRFSNAHLEILTQSLTYLSFSDFSSLQEYDDEKEQELFAEHPLLRYSDYFLLHAIGQAEVHLQEKLLSFLKQIKRWKDFWQFRLGSDLPPWEDPSWYWAASASPLCVASSLNLHTIANYLLDGAVRTNRNSLRGALCAAAYCGHPNMVELLIKKGADPNIRGGVYGTALQAASLKGHKVVVQLLIDKGAKVNWKGGEDGTALHAASVGGHQAIVQLLIENGADVNMHSESSQCATALQAAAGEGHESVVLLLIDNGADVNAQGGESGTALQAASERGHKAVVQLLLAEFADVNMLGGYCGQALQAASARGKRDVFRLLILHGANVNAQGGSHGSALQAASAEGHGEVVQILIENGANVNTPPSQHETALQAATAEGHEAFVQLLIVQGANVNAPGRKNWENKTALQIVFARHHEVLVNILIEHGADTSVLSEM
ncbi:ankyrin repeat-containing domain protein [Mycena vulgaris]|nr:ankyrin repeat-containing domain protein [Mycena vulgaris]